MTTKGKPKSAESAGERGLLQDIARLARLWPYLKKHRLMMLYSIVLIPIISGFQTLLPVTLRHAIDQGISQHDQKALFLWSAAFAVIVIFEYIVRAGQSVATSYGVLRTIRELRVALVEHVLGFKAAYHDRTLSGVLTTRATSDFDNLSESLNMGVLTLVVDLAVLIGIVVGMFLLNWQLATIACLVLPIVFVIVQWFSKALKQAMLKTRVKIAALNGYTQECLFGNATVKLLTAETAAAQQFDKFNLEFRDAQMGSVVLDALMFAILDGIASVTMGLALWYVVQPAGGILTAGVIVAFIQYIQLLFDPLKNLGNKMAMLQGAFSSLDRIFGIMDHKEHMSGSAPASAIKGDICFDHVSFSYGPDKPGVLKDVSFSVTQGQSLAIVGTTGSGKSTIIKLITKLYDQFEGTITLDGQDIRGIDPHSLRMQMAIVPQDIVLFDGTIAFNISLGLPNITIDRIKDAAKQVGADSFINKLEGGFDHQLRERGANLSFGQRRLLAFARALARDPGLVVLDEATSSVDPESDRVIQEATARILRGRTVIVIAHRLSTIRQCERILLVEKGQIIEEGNHNSLLDLKGAYFKLCHGVVN